MARLSPESSTQSTSCCAAKEAGSPSKRARLVGVARGNSVASPKVGRCSMAAKSGVTAGGDPFSTAAAAAGVHKLAASRLEAHSRPIHAELACLAVCIPMANGQGVQVVPSRQSLVAVLLANTVGCHIGDGRRLGRRDDGHFNHGNLDRRSHHQNHGWQNGRRDDHQSNWRHDNCRHGARRNWLNDWTRINHWGQWWNWWTD